MKKEQDLTIEKFGLEKGFQILTARNAGGFCVQFQIKADCVIHAEDENKIM